MTDEPLVVLDLFAGKKGWSRRFAEAGHHVVTTDIDPAFRCNLTADILTVTADDLRRLSPTGYYDLILASPPCEAFSNAALSKNWWALAACLNCGEQVRLVKRVKGSRGHTWEHVGAGCDEPDALIPGKPEVVPRSDKARLGMALVEHTLKLIADLESRAWVMENPTAMMRRLPILADVELRPVTYCLAGETGVITRRGTFPIKDLEGTYQEILSTGGRWTKAPIQSFGKQRLMKIKLSRAGQQKTIFATPEHHWFVRRHANTKYQEVETSNLELGHRLRYATPERVQAPLNPTAVARGFTYGDGFHVNAKGRKPRCYAQFCGDKDEALLPFFEGWGGKRSRDDKDELRITRIGGLPLDWKTSMPTVEDGPGIILGWLAGYFAADGSVSKAGQARLSSSRFEDLEAVRTLCRSIGVGTYGIQTRMRKGYGTEDSPLHEITFMRSDLEPDFFLIAEHRRRIEALKPPKHQARCWVVQSVEWTDRFEEVFCATVSELEAFALEDDILTHNCRYGMSYKKPTDLWGNFPPTLVLDLPCDTSYRPLEYADVDGTTYVVDATTGQPCHEAASRGAKTGLQGVDNAADRALVPDELSQAVLDAMESWRAFGWSL